MIIFLVIILFSSQTMASFQEIWNGYQTSYKNEIRELESEAIQNNLKYQLSSNSWKLKLSTEYDNTFLDALFSFQAQQTIKYTNSIGIERNTFRYGNFSYTLSNSRYDLSNWVQGVGTTNVDEVYETRGTFNYNIDFLNRSNLFEENRIVQNQIVNSINNSLEAQKEYLGFFRAYLEAKLNVYLRDLSYEIEKRAQKRLKLIKRRVKDGLSRTVEQLQAESSLLNQKQEVNKSENSLKESLSIIEIVLKRSIPEEYLEGVKWNYHSFADWKESIVETKNLELKLLEERMRLINIESDKVDSERGHSLKLSASYVSNSFNEEPSDSFDEALNNPKNDSKVIGLEYSIPFGDSYHNTTMTKQKIDKQRVEYQRLSIKDKIEMEENVLVHNISKFEDSYLLAKRQVVLTKKILSEQNKLYLRGLATFDDVIRAEESYINATVEEKRVLFTYENLIIDYAFLKGSLINIIKRYKD